MIHLVNETQLISHPQHPKFIWIQDFSVLIAVLGIERKDTYGTSAYIYPEKLLKFKGKSFWVDLGGLSFIVRNGVVRRVSGPFKTVKYKHSRVAYVTLYSVSREYGGPEEGGWYYDYWVHEEHLGRCRFSRVHKMVDKFRAIHEAPKCQRFNVRGGPDLQVGWDWSPGASATSARPHYE